MKSTKTSSAPKAGSSAAEFAPRAVRNLFPGAAAALGAVDAPASEAKRESAFDAGGVELADIGARLRWVDEAKCEDNPFQTRDSYDDSDEGHIQGIAQSFNRVGQLQPGIARPHPDKRKRDAGWLQIGAGHSRLRAVREGGNAGSNLPEPLRFSGKLLVLVRELSDIEMAVIAIEENENRENPNVIERAKGYLRLKELLDQDGQGSTWRAFAESRGFTYERLRQLARLLELPEKLQKSIADGWWNEKHGRAVLSLREEPKLQEMLIRQIGNEQLSGNAASKRARDLMSQIPNQTRMNVEAAVKREQENAAFQSAERAHEENRAAMDGGTAHLRLVGKTEAGEGISPISASEDARTVREAVTELVPSPNAGPPLLATLDDTPNRLRRVLFGLAGLRKEIQRGDFEERAHLLALEGQLEDAIERVISLHEALR